MMQLLPSPPLSSSVETRQEAGGGHGRSSFDDVFDALDEDDQDVLLCEGLSAKLAAEENADGK